MSPVLALLMACGGGSGGSSPTTPGGASPTTLVYTDPSGDGWKLIRNAEKSTPSHLVLDLLGPSGESGFGVGLALAADPAKVGWGKVASSDPDWVKNLRYGPNAGEAFQKAVVKGGGLRVGVFHKGTRGVATAYSGPLLSLALELKTESLSRGSSVDLAVKSAQELRSEGLRPITLLVGTLVVQ